MYSIVLKAYILFSFILITFCNGENRIGDYDQLVLDQVHPVAAFLIAQKQWPEQGNRPDDINLSPQTWDTLDSRAIWTASAFWPSKVTGSNPTNCFSSTPSVQIDTNLQETLRSNFPNYSSKDEEETSWGEAWKSFGTCMTNLDAINTADDYFRVAINLLLKSNLGILLWADNRFTGSEYSVEQLTSSIRRMLSIDAHLQCIQDTDGKQYLLGGSICFNMLLDIEECKNVSPSTCDPSKQVLIPKSL